MHKSRGKPAQSNDFKSLQLDTKAFDAYRTSSSARHFLGPDAGADEIEESLKIRRQIRLVGGAAQAFGDTLDLTLSKLDDTALFLMRRIENLWRIPNQFWHIYFRKVREGKKSIWSSLSGGEFLAHSGILDPKNELYLVPNTAKDKKLISNIIENLQSTEVEASPAVRFNFGSDKDHENETWREKCQRVFSLHPSQDPRDVLALEEQSKKSKKSKKSKASGSADMEDEEMEDAGAGKEKEGESEEVNREAQKKQREQKKHLTKLFEGVENHLPTESDWEKYYEARRVAGDVDAERSNDEEVQDVVTKIRRRMKKVLDKTSLTPEEQQLLMHSAYFVSLDVVYEDVDEIRSLSSSVRIYSLCSATKALDLQFYSHERMRYSSVERGEYMGFKLNDNPSTPGHDVEDAFSKYGIHLSKKHGWRLVYSLVVPDDADLNLPGDKWVYTEKHKWMMTRKYINQIRNHIFGGAEELSAKVSDYALLDFVMEATGESIRSGGEGWVGYQMRLNCRALEEHDEYYSEEDWDQELAEAVERMRNEEDEDEDEGDDDDDVGYGSGLRGGGRVGGMGGLFGGGGRGGGGGSVTLGPEALMMLYALTQGRGRGL